MSRWPVCSSCFCVLPKTPANMNPRPESPKQSLMLCCKYSGCDFEDKIPKIELLCCGFCLLLQRLRAFWHNCVLCAGLFISLHKHWCSAEARFPPFAPSPSGRSASPPTATATVGLVSWAFSPSFPKSWLCSLPSQQTAVSCLSSLSTPPPSHMYQSLFL